METATAPKKTSPPVAPKLPFEAIVYYHGLLNWYILPMYGTIGTGSGTSRICCCNDGANCDRPGKHPTIKYKKEEDQTGKRPYRPRPSLATLMKWSRKHEVERGAPANWAVACGPSRIVVIETDQHDGGADGVAQLAILEGEHGPLPSTPTDSRGHRYFLCPRDWKPTKANYLLAPAVELFFDKLAVLPPSRHAGGEHYEWCPGAAPWETPLVELPGRARAIVDAEDKRDADVMAAAKAAAEATLAANQNRSRSDGEEMSVPERARRYVAKMDYSIQGQHGSDRIFAVACVLVRDFALTEDEAWPILVEFNDVRAKPPWSVPELRRKIAEAIKVTAREQRGKLRDAPPPNYAKSQHSTNGSPFSRNGAHMGGESADHHNSNDESNRTAPTNPPQDQPGVGPEGPRNESGADWVHPAPLGADFDSLPTFPLTGLPGFLGGFVKAEAEAVQVPRDLPAMLGLTFLGAGIARKVRVQVRPGWQEPVNIYSVTAMPPSERKSAVFADCIKPVQEFQARQQELARPGIAEALAQKRILEGRLKAAESRAAKKDNVRAQAIQEALDLAKELAKFEVPPNPVFFVDDATPEALVKLLCAQGGRLLVAAPEGTAFEIVRGRYSETENFDVYLKGHSGDPLDNWRVSRDSSSVERPALSAALAVQPTVIRGLAESATMRGKGFLARWFYSLAKSRVGSRKSAPDPVPQVVAERYSKVLSAAWAISYANGNDPHVIQFSTPADHALRALQEWLEPQLAEGGDLAHIGDWAGKLAGGCARIAAILHVATALDAGEPWHGDVSDKTVETAIEIGRDYLLPHAKAAFGLMAAVPQLEVAKKLLKWICRHGRPQFKAHEAFKDLANQSDFQEIEDVDLALTTLAKYGYVRSVEPEKKPVGRTPALIWVVNPRTPGFFSKTTGNTG